MLLGEVPAQRVTIIQDEERAPPSPGSAINYCSFSTDKGHDRLLGLSGRASILTFISILTSTVSETALSLESKMISHSVSHNLTDESNTSKRS